MTKMERLVAELTYARLAYEAADKALEAHVRPLVLQHLEMGNYEAARKLAGQCGDSLTQVFLLDTIRQHGLEHEEAR